MSKHLDKLAQAQRGLQSGMAQQLAAQQQALAAQYNLAAQQDNRFLMERLSLEKAKSQSAAGRLEQAQQLLDADLINVDQMKQMLGINTDGSLKVTMETGPKQDKVRDGVSAPISKSDLTKAPNCPNCHSQHQISMTGEVNVAGHIHDMYSCGACNHIFTRQQGGLRNFIDKVAEAANVSPGVVTVALTNCAVGNGEVITTNTPMLTDWSGISRQVLQTNNHNLETEARNQTQELRNLKYEVTNLLGAMREIIEQNHRLQEKMATDPLVGMRDKINQFEIK